MNELEIVAYKALQVLDILDPNLAIYPTAGLRFKDPDNGIEITLDARDLKISRNSKTPGEYEHVSNIHPDLQLLLFNILETKQQLIYQDVTGKLPDGALDIIKQKI